MISLKKAYEARDPVRASFLRFGVPAFDEREIEAMSAVLRSGWIGQGEQCVEFERKFAQYVHAPEAIFVSSCTAGLHLSLFALGIGAGDEVITTPLTFVATVNVIEHVGATPVLADIDAETLNINTAEIAKKVTSRTKAVIGVHFGGKPINIAEIRDALPANVAIVEDAAHAVAARFSGGDPVGSSPNLTSFSFYANKNLSTGEGGMITTRDTAIAEKLRICRLHGLSSDAWKRYKTNSLLRSLAILPGFKYNATDMQAALGLVQLEKLNANQMNRERIAAFYDAALAKVASIKTISRSNANGERHALHLYSVLLALEELDSDRDGIVRGLRSENIGIGIHYDAIHSHPFYRETYDWPMGSLPVAERVAERIISLPISPSMSDADAGNVVDALVRVLGYYRR